MQQSLPITLSVAFIGDDPTDLINSCPDMYRAVWRYCGGIANSSIKVHMQERLADEPLEWELSVSTPSGRRSVRAIQRTDSGAVTFTAS